MKAFPLVVFVFSFFSLQAQDFEKYGMDTSYIPVGLEVGIQAPDFTLATGDKANFSLSETLKTKQVIVVFYRGQWCPYCNRHLSNLNDSLNLIEAKNAVVVAIGPETIKNKEKMKEKTGAQFILLSDKEMSVMSNYDVLYTVTEKYQAKIKIGLFTRIDKNNGQKKAQLPVPATYVIGQDGKIKYKHFQYDYRTRSSVKEILNAL
jgi:peroxiredoxin